MEVGGGDVDCSCDGDGDGAKDAAGRSQLAYAEHVASLPLHSDLCDLAPTFSVLQVALPRT